VFVTQFPLQYKHSFLTFRRFILCSFANSWGRPKSKNMSLQSLQLMGVSKLFNNLNRSSRHTAWCFKEFKGKKRSSCHHNVCVKKMKTLQHT